MRSTTLDRTRRTTTGGVVALATMLVASSAGVAQAVNSAHLARADINGDGVVNWQDLNLFLNAVNNRSVLADINADGRVDDRYDAFMSMMGMKVGAIESQPPSEQQTEAGVLAPVSVLAVRPAPGVGSDAVCEGRRLTVPR